MSLQQLLADLAKAEKGDNALDVRMAVEFFVPDGFTLDKRPNAAGTKVISTYVDHGGKATHGTAWAGDHTTVTDSALRLVAKFAPEMAFDLKFREGAFSSIHVYDPTIGGWRVTGGGTPALAVCRALVAARIAKATPSDTHEVG